MGEIKRFAKKRKVLLVRTAAILVPLVLSLVFLSQTAFAQNTYVITDGSRVFTYTTFATDPEAVLDEAGLMLDEDDSYTTHPGVGTSSITVQRGQDITIEYYGEVISATSHGETVADLLTRLNISLGANDVLSHPLDADTYDGMELRVDEVLHLDQTYTSTISHDVTYCYDATLPQGTEAVLIEGSDGQLTCTATVTYVNGQETERIVHSELVTIQPVTEVVVMGSAAVEAIDPNGWPVVGDGIITLPTGEVLTYTDTMQVVATGYHKSNAGCDDWTSTGTWARVGAIAVDPRMIPYGTRMFIVSNDGAYVYGLATAEDCGGAIKGNRVDLYFDSNYDCFQFGIRDCTIYILG